MCNGKLSFYLIINKISKMFWINKYNDFKKVINSKMKIVSYNFCAIQRFSGWKKIITRLFNKSFKFFMTRRILRKKITVQMNIYPIHIFKFSHYCSIWTKFSKIVPKFSQDKKFKTFHKFYYKVLINFGIIW